MSGIPLRQYVKDIEIMIENGSSDEALKHSWYVLQKFPKHIDTYRLIGKALLSKEQFEELQKVRRLYNSKILIYNQTISVFPTRFLAIKMNLHIKEYFG